MRYDLPLINLHVPFVLDADFMRSQSYGENPENYPGWGGHMGVDLAPAFNTPQSKWQVYAIADGVVQAAGPDGNGSQGWGNWVSLYENCGTFYREWIYAHFEEVYVKPGDVVKKGQLIGKIGSTGRSTGPHVHISTRDRDIKDPSKVLNYNNGYYGHYDPWPLIIKANQIMIEFVQNLDKPGEYGLQVSSGVAKIFVPASTEADLKARFPQVPLKADGSIDYSQAIGRRYGA